MKLNIEAEIIDIGGQLTLIPVDCGEKKLVLQMNETTAEILELLKEETTEDKIVEALQKMYDASESDIRRSVRKVIEHLRKDGLLTE